MTRSLTQEEFENRSNETHKNKYKYTYAIYVNSDSRINIECPTHGIFEQTAHRHLAGQGCKKCAEEYRAKLKKKKASAKFLTEAVDVDVHKNKKYTYEKVVYKRHNEKVIVTCHDHGDFLVTPHNHLNGKGCPSCAVNGYRADRQGSLYLLTEPTGLVKLGITNRCPSTRAAHVSRACGKDFKVHTDFKFQDGRIPAYLETKLLAELRNYYTSPICRFDGYTECFYNVDICNMLTRIHQLIQEHTDAQNKQ